MIATVLSGKADWYLMRSSGFVALALFTLAVGLGIANLRQVARRPETRAASALVHRNVSLLAVVFLALHVVTAVTDRDVHISLGSTFVPGLSGYDPLWVGMGAISVDLTIAVVATSLLRRHVPERAWRVVHWVSYASWPVALAHSIGSGTGRGADTGTVWSTAIYAVCGVAFAVAVAARLWRDRQSAGRRPVRWGAA